MSQLATRRRAVAGHGDDPVTERIVDAALALLLRNGLGPLTVDEIAREAEVARVTVYRRFGGRDELVAAVIRRQTAEVLHRVAAAVAGVGSVEERLVEGFVVLFHLARTHPLLLPVLRADVAVSPAMAATTAAAARALSRDYLAGHLRAATSATAGSATADRARAAEDLDAVAALVVRLSMSFLTAPDSAIPLTTDDDLRRFARRYLVPMIPGPDGDLP